MQKCSQLWRYSLVAWHCMCCFDRHSHITLLCMRQRGVCFVACNLLNLLHCWWICTARHARAHTRKRPIYMLLCLVIAIAGWQNSRSYRPGLLPCNELQLRQIETLQKRRSAIVSLGNFITNSPQAKHCIKNIFAHWIYIAYLLLFYSITFFFIITVKHFTKATYTNNTYFYFCSHHFHHFVQNNVH